MLCPHVAATEGLALDHTRDVAARSRRRRERVAFARDGRARECDRRYAVEEVFRVSAFVAMKQLTYVRL